MTKRIIFFYYIYEKYINISFHFLCQKNIFIVILNKNKNIIFLSYQSYDLLLMIQHFNI